MAVPVPVDAPTAGEMPDPSDMAAYNAWRDSGGGSEDAFSGAEAPVMIDHEALHEDGYVAPVPVVGEAGEEQEVVEGEQTEVEEEEIVPPVIPPTEPGKKGDRLERRMRGLVQEIADLKRMLAEGDVVEEPEVVPPAAAAAPAAVELVAPQLSDYEEFKDWQVAYDAYNAAKTEQVVSSLKAELQAVKAQEAAQVEHAVEQRLWDEQTERWPDFNERLQAAEEAGAKTSPAMQIVMRADPEQGTRMALALAEDPELCTRIAEATQARNPDQVPRAIARAGAMLAKLTLTAVVPTPKAAGGKAAPPAAQPKPGTKTPTVIRTAQRPPSTLRAAPAVAAVNPVYDPTIAEKDYNKWERARNAEIKKKAENV